MRLANVAVTGIGAWCGEIVPELPQQPDQELADCQAVGGRLS
jgi:hypothetical protein